MRGATLDTKEVRKVNTIGERLKYARKLRGYSQNKLSEISLVARPVISNIEINRYSTQLANYDAIAKALNINLEWLLKGNELMEVNNERAKIVDELYHEIAGLSKEQQVCLLNMVREIKKLFGDRKG